MELEHFLPKRLTLLDVVQDGKVSKEPISRCDLGSKEALGTGWPQDCVALVGGVSPAPAESLPSHLPPSTLAAVSGSHTVLTDTESRSGLSEETQSSPQLTGLPWRQERNVVKYSPSSSISG